MMWYNYEKQGTGYDPGAAGYELQGRASRADDLLGKIDAAISYGSRTPGVTELLMLAAAEIRRLDAENKRLTELVGNQPHGETYGRRSGGKETLFK